MQKLHIGQWKDNQSGKSVHAVIKVDHSKISRLVGKAMRNKNGQTMIAGGAIIIEVQPQ